MSLTPDGRDPGRVPENWRDLLDPAEWRLNAEGVPARRAARVIALRRDPVPAILVVTGHDASDRDHWWAFTPGGGILPGESPRQAAVRELTEETGLVLAEDELVGPVLRRSSLFVFNLVTSRQDEEIFLARLDGEHGAPAGGADSAEGDSGPGDSARADAAMDRSELDRSGWTDLEREVLDSLRWWSLDELDAAVAVGTTVYPQSLPVLARELLGGWDGVVRRIREEG